MCTWAGWWEIRRGLTGRQRVNRDSAWRSQRHPASDHGNESERSQKPNRFLHSILTGFWPELSTWHRQLHPGIRQSGTQQEDARTDPHTEVPADREAVK